MRCVIDHLQVDHRVHVLQDFSDARGAWYRAGQTAVLRAMDLEWQSQEIAIKWERGGAREALYFSLGANDGPRNGRMRDYFSLGERVPLPEDTLTGRRRQKPVPVPEVVEEPITDATRYDEAASRVWALAARRRFEEAEAQIRLILAGTDPNDGRLENLACDMVGIASSHAEDADRAVYDWARSRAMNLWHAWGSGATGGGEGAVRGNRIRKAEEHLAQCDARRRESGRTGDV